MALSLQKPVELYRDMRGGQGLRQVGALLILIAVVGKLAFLNLKATSSPLVLVEKDTAAAGLTKVKIGEGEKLRNTLRSLESVSASIPISCTRLRPQRPN